MALAAVGAWARPSSQAVFERFDYEGHDEYYNRRPLAAPGEFYNPVLPGWFSDPSICRRGEDYWMVTSTFGYYPGVPLYHSTDLVNWELVRNVLDRPSQLDGLGRQSLDKGGIYAPQISYNPANGLFYMITTDVGRANGHFYVTAADPRADWSEPVFLNGIDGIDPSFFFDEDGSAYIVYKEETKGAPKWSNYRCIRFIAFDTAAGNTVGDSWPLNEAGVGPDDRFDRAEGPHIYKIDGRYYLLTAEGGTGVRHSANIYRADDIRGPYLRSWRNPILTQRHLKASRSNPVTCAGHADLVQTPEGDWWAVFLGSRPGPGGFQALGRETFMMPVKWSADGFPYMIQCESDTVPLVLSRPGAVRRDGPATYGNFAWHDDFTTDALRPEWMSLRGPVEGCAAGRGRLCLPCSEVTSSSKTGTPAYMGRRIQHHSFTASTVVDFKAADDSERAGLMLLKNEGSQYLMAVGQDVVELYRISRKGRELLASQRLEGNGRRMELQVVADGVSFSFNYRPAGAADWTQLADGVDASHISCERTGGFTGATIGMYAETAPAVLTAEK